MRFSESELPRLSAWGTGLELARLGLQVRRASLLNKFLVSLATARSPMFSRSDFQMQRFESCRLSRPVRLQRILNRTALEMSR
jgi:hypothetical protein